VGEEVPKAKGRETRKENQGEKGLYKRGEANPSRRENPPGWELCIGLASQFRKNKFCCEISVQYNALDICKTTW